MCLSACPSATWRISVPPVRPRSTDGWPTVSTAEPSICRSLWLRSDPQRPFETILGVMRCQSWSGHVCVAPGQTFLPALTCLASPGQRLWKATFCQSQWKSEGPPSSDKDNLERKGKIVKRGAKGHKGKKKTTPPLNKTEDQDRC